MRDGQAALEYVLALAGLLVVVAILWGLVAVVIRHAGRTEALVTADYGRVRLFSIAGALAGFALCAAGLFPPARRAGLALGRMLRHVFVIIRGFRWIKVIFR